jgi:hypothetical protein
MRTIEQCPNQFPPPRLPLPPTALPSVSSMTWAPATEKPSVLSKGHPLFGISVMIPPNRRKQEAAPTKSPSAKATCWRRIRRKTSASGGFQGVDGRFQLVFGISSAVASTIDSNLFAKFRPSLSLSSPLSPCTVTVTLNPFPASPTPSRRPNKRPPNRTSSIPSSRTRYLCVIRRRKSSILMLEARKVGEVRWIVIMRAWRIM